VRWIALVEQTDHVCCRYRLAAFRPLLANAGQEIELVALPRGWWGRIRLFHRLRGADVILQRKLLPGWQLALLRRYVRRLLFDFDDAVFLRDSYSPKGLYDSGRLRRFAATVRNCDAVIAGNAFLGEQAARWLDRRRVHVIPTCVDPQRYPTANPQKAGEGVQLVWIGSSSTLKGLERITPLLEEIGQRIPGLCLKLVCDRFLSLRHLGVIARPWTEAGEAAELASADVGISWIPDDPWSRGKCGLKVLQFMAAGLPVVANPVGVHPEMIRPGQTGFLAATIAEWVDALSRLARDPALRRRMGQAGRLHLESNYGIAVGASHWLGVLNGLAERSARTA
jgi:glycosyltransferase involved in cell wall biosynthesis